MKDIVHQFSSSNEMYPCRSARLKEKGGHCFSVLVNNAKRLVSRDANSANSSGNSLDQVGGVQSEPCGAKKAITFSKTKQSLTNQASCDLKRFLEEVCILFLSILRWKLHFSPACLLLFS